jgi:hypothetical protein
MPSLQHYLDSIVPNPVKCEYSTMRDLLSKERLENITLRQDANASGFENRLLMQKLHAAQSLINNNKSTEEEYVLILIGRDFYASSVHESQAQTLAKLKVDLVHRDEQIKNCRNHVTILADQVSYWKNRAQEHAPLVDEACIISSLESERDLLKTEINATNRQV